MGIGLVSIIALFAFIAVGVTAEPLTKEILNLPPLIHFTDLFNKEHEKIKKFLGTRDEPDWPYPPWTIYPPQWPVFPPQWPVYPPQWPSKPIYPGYPTHPGIPTYPILPGHPPIGYPPKPTLPIHPQPYPPQQQTVYPPYPSYPPYAATPPYPQYPPYPPSRQFDTEVIDRYYKYNEDGSKEYKLMLNNGLVIYQKIMNKNGDNQNIQLLEGYYSDKRNDNTYLITHFRADENGYSASSETRDSPPPYPDIKDMIRLPLPASTKKLQE